MDDDIGDQDARASGANRPLHLATEPVTVTFHSGQTEDAEAEVRFVMLPSPKIEVAATFTERFDSYHGLIGWNEAGTVRVSFPQRDAAADLIQRTVRVPNGPHLIAIVGNDEITMPVATELTRVAFRVLNFEEFFTPVAPAGTHGRRFRDESLLEAGGWRVTIANTPSTHETIKALRAGGGHGVTHAGELVRADGAPFAAWDVEEVLRGLHYFLAFARGRWAPPLLPVGYADDGSRAWERWHVPTSDPWGGGATWFDRQHGNQLAEAYPGFWALWSSRLWNDVLPKAVHWFVSSNTGDGGVEGALVLSCTALELLAWVTLVEDRQALTAKQFKNLGGAAARLGYFLTALGIPVGVPAETQRIGALATAAPNDLWDGPTAVIRLRNSVVHPEERDRASHADEHTRAEAWQLAQWYVELVLLRLFGYTGTYYNRLEPNGWVGTVAPVPWAANPAGT